MSESLFYVATETAKIAAANCILAVQRECRRAREEFIADYMKPRWWRRSKTRKQAEEEANFWDGKVWHCEWSEWYVGGYELPRARKMLRALNSTDTPHALLCSDEAALVAKYKDAQ